MFRHVLLSLGTFLSVATAQTTQLQGKTNIMPAAPTYYLAAQVKECSADQLLMRGASNLPAGSSIGIQVSQFFEDAWKDYSDAAFATLGDNGFFNATLHPLPKLTFHRNLVVRIYFSPGYHKQPQNVLAAVGKRGEGLGE